MTASIAPALPAAQSPRMTLSICLAAAVLPLTFSGGAIATPALGRAFGETGPLLTWIVNAFMMVFGALPLIAGALADRIGRRRVFHFGVVGFALSGFALILAPSLLVVDLLRGLQGVFAAATLAGGSAVLAQIPEDDRRRRAFSLLGATFGLGLALGPVLAGWALGIGGWRGVFALASGLALAALLSGIGAIPESRTKTTTAFDHRGALLFAGALCALTAWAILVPTRGLGSSASLGLILAGILLGGLFIGQERRCPAPMFDLTLLRDPAFLGVQALPVATCFGFVSLLVIVPLQLIGAGHSELEAARISMALSAPVFLVPVLVVPRLRISRSQSCAAGLGLAALGLFGLGLTPFDGPLLPLVLMLAVIGCGIGLPWGMMDGLAVEVAPRAKAGVAMGMFSTVRVASEGIVLALVSATHSALVARLARTSTDTAAAIVAGGPVAATLRPSVTEASRWLFWGLALLTALAALFVLRRLRDK